MRKTKLSLCIGLIAVILSSGFDKPNTAVNTNSFFISSVSVRTENEHNGKKINVVDESEEDVEYSFAIVEFISSLFS